MKIEIKEELDAINRWIEVYETNQEYVDKLKRRIKLQEEVSDQDIGGVTSERQLLLQHALYTTAGTGYFSVGERICINQERGYLLSIGRYTELRPYQVSETIERKINELKL